MEGEEETLIESEQFKPDSPEQMQMGYTTSPEAWQCM